MRPSCCTRWFGTGSTPLSTSSLRPRSPAFGSSIRPGRWRTPADRDHCLQYMVAVPLIFGRLTAADYEDEVAADPRIDRLPRPDGGSRE
ncbi:MAG: hypothetical protein WDM77_01530 [Steroidobacteraceae bacterium]